ncbi:aminotransferase class I/II-fold pyridoxal phosphate-dependent enzyme [Jannaschia sp. Os4]|uniref:aminotransferase class I/II-fold pyridoxal phosphate-dependent enzyme n=1 Tax=Jannaschia sp. Os4 TaxID=2807617 RepID=UPI001939A33C|nr:aminotransferase class I/II-fold pyridoxal phosphate-dependent enzyme [Jannaschia sp. Os4]MBM2574788.1 aminotransferase class I/II-fold pyridoxal phosphate-dependent enzyme [Jannaschia sp. Os4]
MKDLRALHGRVAATPAPEASIPSAPPEAAPRAKVRSRGADVGSHPLFRQVSVGRAMGQVTGLASPFFRTVSAVDGIRAEVEGRWVDHFASYDYLSMNGDPRLHDAATAAMATYGVSARAARPAGGNLALHEDLDAALAAFVGHEAALVTVSGHATNVAIIRTLMGPEDVVLADALSHNSVFEGIRASGATHVSVPHDDADWLDDWLTANRHKYGRALICVEGLYSMDGDCADLPAFVEVKERHDAWLTLDEAHSFGVLGATGRGLCEATGVDPRRVDVIMGTLSKTLCSCGGVIAGSRDLIDLMRYNAPGFLYSVGMPVPSAAATLAALRIMAAEPERVARLASRGATMLRLMTERGLETGPCAGHAVTPVIIGDSLRTAWVSNGLLEDGVNVPCMVAPALPDRSARLRFFLNADHTDDVLERAADLTAARVRASREVRL